MKNSIGLRNDTTPNIRFPPKPILKPGKHLAGVTTTQILRYETPNTTTGGPETYLLSVFKSCHWSLVDSLHKEALMQKGFSFQGVIMIWPIIPYATESWDICVSPGLLSHNEETRYMSIPSSSRTKQHHSHTTWSFRVNPCHIIPIEISIEPIHFQTIVRNKILCGNLATYITRGANTARCLPI